MRRIQQIFTRGIGFLAVLLVALICAPALAQENPGSSGDTTGGETGSETGSNTGGDTSTEDGGDTSTEGGGDTSEGESVKWPGNPGSVVVNPGGSGDVGPSTPASRVDGKLVLSSTDSTQIAAATIGGRTENILWQLSVRGPVRRGDERLAVAELDGLADSTSVNASISYLYWQPETDINAQTQVCAEFAVENYVCEPDHDSTVAVQDDLVAAREAVCKRHQACTREGIPSIAGQFAYDEISRPFLESATKALCEAQKSVVVESMAQTCRRDDLLGVSISWARRWDRARGEERIQVCREFAAETFQCTPPSVEIIEQKATELGLGEARAVVCKQHIPCTRQRLSNVAQSEWDEAQSAICERDKQAILAQPRRRAPFCTGKQIRDRLRRATAPVQAERLKALLDRYQQAVRFDRTILATLRLRYARQLMEWADGATLEPRSGLANMGAIGVSVATVLPSFGSIALSYEFERDFVEGPRSSFCRPVSNVSTALQCADLAFGEPVEATGHILRLELRRFLSENLAIAARGAFEARSKVWAFDVPVYFLRDRQRGLAGGVSLGYRSDVDRPLFTVFISERMSLLP